MALFHQSHRGARESTIQCLHGRICGPNSIYRAVDGQGYGPSILFLRKQITQMEEILVRIDSRGMTVLPGQQNGV